MKTTLASLIKNHAFPVGIKVPVGGFKPFDLRLGTLFPQSKGEEVVYFNLAIRYERGTATPYCLLSLSSVKNGMILQEASWFPIDNTEFDVDNSGLDEYRSLMMKDLKNNLSHCFKIGSDPEIFVKDKDGAMIPAFLFLGSKEAPDKTSDRGCYGISGGQKAYWDGFQGEFTTLAATCVGEHTNSIAAGLRTISELARAKFPGSSLSVRTVYDIPFELLQSSAEEHVAFGCMPSMNAYDHRVDMPPARQVPFRSSGGHIHLGLGKMTKEQAIPIVKTLDAILGVASVSLFASIDDPRRRILYGLPGEFRLPPHGVEYRPLSSAWLCHPMITNLVFDLTRKVTRFGQIGLLSYWRGNEEETIDTMVRSDVSTAKEVLNRNKDIMIQLLSAAYHWAEPDFLEKLFGILLNGVESVIAEPGNLEKNWRLDRDDWTLYTNSVSRLKELVGVGMKV